MGKSYICMKYIEKLLEESQYTLKKRALSKLKIGRNFLNLIRVLQKHSANVTHLGGETLSFHL